MRPDPRQPMASQGLIQHIVGADDDDAVQAVAGRQRGGDLVGHVKWSMTPQQTKPTVPGRREAHCARSGEVPQCGGRRERPLLDRNRRALQGPENRPPERRQTIDGRVAHQGLDARGTDGQSPRDRIQSVRNAGRPVRRSRVQLCESRRYRLARPAPESKLVAIAQKAPARPQRIHVKRLPPVPWTIPKLHRQAASALEQSLETPAEAEPRLDKVK